MNNSDFMQKMLLACALNPMFYKLLEQNAGIKSPVATSKNTHSNCNLNLNEHLKYADALILAGIIDENTGKSMKNKMTAAFSVNNSASVPVGAAQNQATTAQSGTENALNPTPPDNAALLNSEFLKARTCLLNYLKGLDIRLNEEDLKEIETVVLELEKAALQRKAAEISQNPLAMLQNANEVAKERLSCGSLGANKLKSPQGKTFTRDEISKMSTAEFLENEPTINFQLQNGLL